MNILLQIPQNKYFYSLIFFLVLHIIIKNQSKWPTLDINLSHRDFLLVLDNFYINPKEMKHNVFMISLYVMLYFGIILLWRISFLGNSQDIDLLSSHSMQANTFMTFILFSLNLVLYFEILNNIFYMHSIRLHLRLLKYKWYENFKDFWLLNSEIITDLIVLLESFLLEVIMTEEELDKMYARRITLSKILPTVDRPILSLEEIYLTKRHRLWVYLNEHKYIKLCFMFVERIVWFFQDNSSGFVYYLRHTLVVLTLSYDLFQGKLYYIYYALLIFFLLKTLRKMRIFLTVKDPLELLITNHFYVNQVPYEEVIKYTKENNSTFDPYKLPDYSKEVLNHWEELIPYINSYFRIYYVVDPTRSSNHKILRQIYRRIHVLFLIVLGICYFGYNHEKYYIILLGFQCYPALIFSVFGGILYGIHKRVAYVVIDNNPRWVENKIYKLWFYLLAIITLLPMAYIMMKNKTIILANENIYDFKHFISIIEIFSLEEKSKYFDNYLYHLEKTLRIPDQQWLEIIRKIKGTVIITESSTLEEIRDHINRYVKEKLFPVNVKVLSFKEAIFVMFDKIIKWFGKQF